jgi:hypothetical protein
MAEEVDLYDFLAHYGVPGMKWGKRKSRDAETPKESNSKVEDNKLHVSKDGAITLKKGATLQRVVRNSDGLLMKKGEVLGSDFSYMSFTKADNAQYEVLLGRRQNIFNKKASEVVSLTASKDLKSPAPKEAASIYFKTLASDAKLKESAKSFLPNKGIGFTKADIDKAIADPKSARSLSLYAFAYDQGNYGKTGSVNSSFHKSVSKSGYNMLLDVSDAAIGYADKPVIMLNPSANLTVTGKRTVDKLSLKSANKVLREQEKISNGKTFLEELGLDEF